MDAYRKILMGVPSFMGTIFLNITLICYLTASIGYFVFLVYRMHWVSGASLGSVGIGLAFHTAFMGLRSMETGHGPYTNSFEVGVFCSWIIVGLFLFLHWRYKIKDLGAFAIPLVFLILLYAAFMSQEALGEPIAELQLWLTLHR